jgi:16S rRNA (cytidine1402-2'-O)-methyltransferase
MPGTLYVVATPIGNLEDITLRALRILKEVALIAAEDTRVTRKLLSHFDIHTPLTSFHQHTRGIKAEGLVEKLSAGQSIALVSDAGMPAISDPGSDLVTLALAAGITVTPIPGANAALSALVVSGLHTSRFAFDGFPPRTRSDRREFFEALREERRTVMLYESPARILSTLRDLHSTLGDRPVAVARELTKLFEEVYRGPLTGAIAHFTEHKPRGEFTIVLGGVETAPRPTEADNPEQQQAEQKATLEAALNEALRAGVSSRDAVQQVAARLKLPRRYVYSTLLQLKKD